MLVICQTFKWAASNVVAGTASFCEAFDTLAGTDDVASLLQGPDEMITWAKRFPTPRLM